VIQHPIHGHPPYSFSLVVSLLFWLLLSGLLFLVASALPFDYQVEDVIQLEVNHNRSCWQANCCCRWWLLLILDDLVEMDLQNFQFLIDIEVRLWRWRRLKKIQ
jgi:hypothetical protein